MSSPRYQITSASPVTIFRRQQKQTSYNLYNIDPANDIYLDDTPQTPGNPTGLPLHPGAQITWESGRECYAMCAPGLTATLLTSPAAGGYFDPYTLATNILTLAPGGLTLAQQIANSISITGAPPIDMPGMPHNALQVVASGVAPVTTAIVDVAIYNFVEVWAYETGVIGPNTSTRAMTLTWYADLAATTIVHSQVYYYGSFNGNIGVKLPIPGGAKALRLSWTAAATVQAVNLHSWVFASMRSGAQSSYNGDSNAVAWAGTPADGLGGSGEFIYAQGGVIAPVANTMYPQSYEGPAKLYVQASVVAAGGSFTVLLMDYVHGNAFAAVILGVSAAFQSQVVDILMPRRPIRMTATIAGANVTNPSALLIMTPW